MAFRPGMVDLPEEHREAAVNAITLPEVFHDFDTALPELNDVDIEQQFSINQSRADEITMREDYGTLPISIHDDGFGDMGFDSEPPDLARDGIDPNIDESLFADEMGIGNSHHHSKEPMPGTSRSMLDSIDIHENHHNNHHHHSAMSDDGFGDEFGQPAAGLFEGDIFADAPLASTTLPPGAMTSRSDSDDDMDHFDGGAPSPAPSSDDDHDGPMSPMPGTSSAAAAAAAASHLNLSDQMSPGGGHLNNDHSGGGGLNTSGGGGGDETPDQAALLNEEESFALAPVDASALKGVTKAKRKRKLIVDEVKNISGEEMKSQLANTSDIVTTLDLAPPTKRLMYWKETGGVEKLFALPSRDIPARALSKLYQRHLTSRHFGIEDFSVLGPADLLALEQQRVDEPQSPALNSKRGRKRKNQENASNDVSSSLAEPDLVRDFEQPPDTPMTSNLEMRDQSCLNNESLMPPPATPATGMQTMSSPSHSQMLNFMPMTPGIPMTPGGDGGGGGVSGINDGMTPIIHHTDEHLPESGLLHEGMGSVDLQHGSLTPGGLDHGGMTPHHTIENIDSIPNLPADQVSSILNGTGMENIGYANMGFDGPPSSPRGAIANDWNDDYDFPPSVGHVSRIEKILSGVFFFESENKRLFFLFVDRRRTIGE